MDLAVEVDLGLVAGAAEIRRVGDDRVDDEPPRSVVGAEPEPDVSRGVERIVYGDRPARAADPLVCDRARLPDVAGSRVDDQGSLAVHLDALGAVDPEADLVRIDPGGDDEVVLQAAGTRVVHEVDARVDVVVSDAAVRRRADGRVDAAVGKVADDARKQTASHRPRRGVRADPLHAEYGVPAATVTERQDGLGRRQERGVGCAPRHELHVLVDLAAVGFEADPARQGAVGSGSRGQGHPRLRRHRRAGELEHETRDDGETRHASGEHGRFHGSLAVPRAHSGHCAPGGTHG